MDGIKNISTHDLIQRSTWAAALSGCHQKYFNSRPHTEVDPQTIQSGYTRVEFQLTTSYRGRPSFSVSANVPSIFQLTTSYRGRPYTTLSGVHSWHFNSRPHTEVDVGRQWDDNENVYFNSRPHTEVDLSNMDIVDFSLYFNSRPHTEVDISTLHLYTI